MSDDLLAVMRQQAKQVYGEAAEPRAGHVSSYNPDTGACRIKLLPEQVETNWLPVLSQWVGNGWGLIAAPSIDDPVIAIFLSNDWDNGFIVGRLFNNDFQPPAAPSGELWAIHKSGTYLKLKNDGSLDIKAATKVTGSAPQWNLTGTFNLTGTTNISGPLNVTKNIKSDAQIADSKGSMASMRTTFNGHDHNDPQGGTTTTPNQSM